METVILVHGLWMRGIVLMPQQHWLARHGYAVRRFSYASMRYDLQHNADALARFVVEDDSATIHLVGHSLGGLVILRMLETLAEPRLGRVVLMGAPTVACHSASTLMHAPLLHNLIGPSLKEWLALPRPQLPATVEIGVLAGRHSVGLGRLIPGLPRPNDGVVAIAETRLAEARDFVVLNVSHSGMLLSRACAAQIAAFLGNGSFIHGNASEYFAGKPWHEPPARVSNGE